MRLLFLRMMVMYYNFCMFVHVQLFRLRCRWYGVNCMWDYTWKQVACAIIAHKLRLDRKNGIEPCMEHIKTLRTMEAENKVQPSPL